MSEKRTNQRARLQSARRWVIKLGSSLLTDNGCGLRLESLQAWVTQIMSLRAAGSDVVIVSSGAVAEGVSRLGWSRRPNAIHELQAAAAIGQMGLIQAYEASFARFNTHTAQILLTHEDIADRRRYLNARSSLRTLLKLGIIPVINENDTVSTDEIRFGDNDTLAGLVANLIEADVLVILTDQDGLFDADPRENAGAKLIESAEAGSARLDQYAGKVGKLGRGGMLTKLRAAAIAARSGASTVIASGLASEVLSRIAAGERIGTLLISERAPITARKQWLAGQSRLQGKLVLDAGAVNVLRDSGRSLLAVGITAVEGNFRRGEIVACIDAAGCEIARGLVNYGAQEARQIMGKASREFEAILGYVDEPELIHRDNLIVLEKQS